MNAIWNSALAGVAVLVSSLSFSDPLTLPISQQASAQSDFFTLVNFRKSSILFAQDNQSQSNTIMAAKPPSRRPPCGGNRYSA
jgi:hypothetical protein